MSRLRRRIPLLIAVGPKKRWSSGYTHGLNENRFLYRKNHIACAAGEMQTIFPAAQA
jgi:hypothetical protein